MMDKTTKKDFYRPMYHKPDDSDDEVDSLSDFQGRASSNGLPKLDKSSTGDRGLQPSSPVPDLLTSDDQEEPVLPAHLQDNYISDTSVFNQWLKLNKKKDMVTVKSSKLKDCVLLYWPPSPNSIPGKNRKAYLASVIEHGGTIAKEWDDGYRITHIVVDIQGKGREYKDVLENLKLQSIPEGVQLVTAAWVDDKISPRWGQAYSSSEDRFRVSGYTKSATTSQDMGLNSSTKKREMHSTLVTGKIKKAKVHESPPYKLATNAQIEPEGVVVPEANPSKHPSPKLMKQRQPFNVGIKLGMNALRSKMPLDVNNNNIDTIMQQIQKAKDDRDIRELIQRGSMGSELTGDNIDRIFEPTQDEAYLEYESEKSDEELLTNKAKGFLCAKKNLKGSVETGPNAALIEQLKCLAAHYAAKKDDAFRAKGYREAISVIRKQKHKIITKEQALELPRVGSSIATKIAEFGKHGSIELVKNFAADPRELAIALFTGIYGVGQRKAEEFYNAGITTLEQLKDIELYEHQRIGLDHYEDFNSRIPRDEVALHVDFVTQAARKINEHLEVVVGGSYRRGEPNSGDVDFLVTASDVHVSGTHLRMVVFEHLIPALKNAGYIKADLTASDTNESSKWMGAACLPDSKTWRRVDILVVPNAEWGAALLYFTGNDIFNRSMRLLARRTGGSLNQKGLFKGVVRGKDGVKMVPGTLVESRDERRIFEALGVKWRPPHERCP